MKSGPNSAADMIAPPSAPITRFFRLFSMGFSFLIKFQRAFSACLGTRLRAGAQLGKQKIQQVSSGSAAGQPVSSRSAGQHPVSSRSAPGQHPVSSRSAAPARPDPLFLWLKSCRDAEFHRAAPQHRPFCGAASAFFGTPVVEKLTPVVEKLTPIVEKLSETLRCGARLASHA